MEAKEAVPIQNETVTLASISYQSFFLSYDKLSGMTGTAETELAEFNNIYNLAVAVRNTLASRVETHTHALHTVVDISLTSLVHTMGWVWQVCPTNRSNARDDSTDVVFKTELSKWSAVSSEIKRMHKTGRPVLVGTTSVERSEFLAGLLTKEGIPFQLLNAKPEFVEKESEIIAQSGRKGQVRDASEAIGLLLSRPRLSRLQSLGMHAPGKEGVCAVSKAGVSFKWRGRLGGDEKHFTRYMSIQHDYVIILPICRAKHPLPRASVVCREYKPFCSRVGIRKRHPELRCITKAQSATWI